MKFLFLLGLLVFTLNFKGQAQDTIHINDQLMVIQLSEKVYVHTSYINSEWGWFGSNGMVVVDGKQAILVDTPMKDELTRQLVNWIIEVRGYQLQTFIPNHWHNDCTEGMDVLAEFQVPTLAHDMTNDLLKEKDLPLAESTFSGKTRVELGSTHLTLHYPGEAHTTDNIVIWVEEEQILFAGCMAKSLSSKSLGHIADANLASWPETLKKVQTEYKDAKVVIPGHGAFGNLDLIKHTIQLIQHQK